MHWKIASSEAMAPWKATLRPMGSCRSSKLDLAQRIVELKQKIDFEKAQFKKHMAKLSVQEVKNFKIMLHELKEAFLKKREEAQGSCERMKSLADKCVQAYNEAEKCKALVVLASTQEWLQRRRRSQLWPNPKHQGRKHIPLSS